MSRTAAARADQDRAARGHAPAIARRVSGPARAPAAVAEAALAPNGMPLTRPRAHSRPPLRLAAGGASLVLRVAEATMEVSGSRTMDRLVRSRAWVVIVAFGLIGIVAMQVSMLKLNNGIGRAVETAATLERGNAALRGEVSRLSSGDRIQALAGSRGYVMPEPGDVTYLRAGTLSADGARAAQRMRAPDPATAGPAGLMTAQNSVAAIAAAGDPSAPAGGVTATGAVASGPAATAPAATAPATGTGTTAPAPGTTAPASAPATASQPAATPAAATPTPATAAATAPIESYGVTAP